MCDLRRSNSVSTPGFRSYGQRMPEDLAPWVAPFVVDVQRRPSERRGTWDLYDPLVDAPRPAVVFVHGGPLGSDLPVSPRDWPVYRGYGSLAAAAGVVGITVDHPLYDASDYPAAHAEVVRAVEQLRTDERVDADRVAIWAFSGGGPLLSPWLIQRPAWLRCLAASYPVLDSRPNRPLPDGFRPVDSLAPARRLAFVLTRVFLESPPIAEGVATFLSRAEAGALALEVIDVPNGYHGFDNLAASPGAVAAIEHAFNSVTAAISN